MAIHTTKLIGRSIESFWVKAAVAVDIVFSTRKRMRGWRSRDWPILSFERGQSVKSKIDVKPHKGDIKCFKGLFN